MPGNQNIIKLHERGIFQNIFPEERSPDLQRALVGSQQCMYCGFDPTADSLHVGNLLAIIALLHGQRAGHNVIAVLGSATAQIGDPSGKNKERDAMDKSTINANVESISKSLDAIFRNHAEHFWPFEKELSPPKILQNGEWYKDKSIIHFLSTTGRNFRMGSMLQRDSVKSRLSTAEGMSLTEFMYQVFQAYDWLHLHKNHKCTIQLGGNDQLGNIVAGFELVKKVTNKELFGITIPLLTTKSGHKFGKSAGNAIWLNAKRTSAFHFYQHFLRLADTEVEKYLNLFTFLRNDQISEIIKQHDKDRSKRIAQKKLASEVTLLVHGDEGLSSALRCTEALYGGSPAGLAKLHEQELRELFSNAKSSELFYEPGTTVFDTVMKTGTFNRAVDAERTIKEGGIYLNEVRMSEASHVLIPSQHILPNNITILRLGKKNYHLVKWLGL
ncbi:hypothetical protein CAPTEDRAFT_18730 [Capitella teleta]|uniref:Tyrosine--tRNA ligase n=1 Tax=Capitella teleta TaxID=283909 RepID=R7TTD4_CAPTE|nr:hypothetical protein CAPTEDRAFT_18730 [Capitella teleta]|eukprot:ELT97168.1 hypothetical protein CAPTEDRAFT_18730 [Capitella teleta]